MSLDTRRYQYSIYSTYFMKTTGWDGTTRGKPEAGTSAERTKRVTERDIELFAEITGDRNPLHFDSEAARRSVFGGLIAQGGVTSGLLNAIVAEDLPGPGTVFLSVEWKFVKAVYVGDSITGRVEIPSAMFRISYAGKDVGPERKVNISRKAIAPNLLDQASPGQLAFRRVPCPSADGENAPKVRTKFCPPADR